MRTTVTLDDDVKVLVKNAMHETDASFKDVVNDGLRRALGAQATHRPVSFQQSTRNMGRLLVDSTNLNVLADELEDRELMSKLAQDR
jgi:Arc/MetJ family transcription regulator